MKEQGPGIKKIHVDLLLDPEDYREQWGKATVAVLPRMRLWKTGLYEFRAEK